MSDQTIKSTTQAFLDIYDISNDIVMMKDGSVAMILTVDALNFGLLAEEEQDAIIYAYAGLLNSLNYNIQILIRSQTKDVTGYLRLLEEQEVQATTRRQKDQISRYRQFVTNLIRERNVLDKKFYVVIPANALEMGAITAQSVIPGVKSPTVDMLDRTVLLERARNNLEPKRDHLIAQFGRIGLYARQLQTQDIIQLFYTAYNPEAGEGQQLTDSNSYTTPVVQARFQGEEMQTPTPSMNPTTAPAPAASAPTPDEVVQAVTSNTAPATPSMPATMPEPSTPAVAADEQAAINSTLGSLGSMPSPSMSSTPSMSTPSVPSTPAVAPVSAPTPTMPSMPTPSMSSTSSMSSPAMPASSSSTAPADAAAPAELPEV